MEKRKVFTLFKNYSNWEFLQCHIICCKIEELANHGMFEKTFHQKINKNNLTIVIVNSSKKILE